MTPDQDPAAPRDTSGAWCAAWQRTSEGFLGGIHHALNNRVAALSAIAQVMAAGISTGQGLEETLEFEVERLQATVGYLRLLRQGPAEAPEPIDLPPMLKSLVELCPHHTDLRDVECELGGDPGIIPVLAPPSLLSRLVLTAMAAAGLAASRTGGRIQVRYGGDERFVTLTVEPVPSGGEGSVDRGEGTDAALLGPGSLDWPVQALGGEVVSRGEAPLTGKVEIRLPTLLEARRRERAAP